MPVTGPKVTVLMSVYNDQGYLHEAVHSILNQTFTDFEFLIIDDGSAEPVAQAVGSDLDERIVIRRQTNRGLTRSLNRGLLWSSGQYVARMDADDVSLPSRLEAQVKELDAHPNLTLVGTFFDIIDGAGDVLETKVLFTDPIYRLWRLQFHNNYGHGSMMMRKQAIMDAGMYDESLSYAQDYDLWSRVSAKTNSSVIPEVLYRYRLVQTGTQASVRNYHDQLAAAIRISNGNLAACNPSLTEDDCIEVRAVYWQFQRSGVSPTGVEAMPGTLEGFCRRYGIEGKEKAQLTERVAQDVIEQIQGSTAIDLSEKAGLAEFAARRLVRR
jgi:glycosyltransferase involved in cell wall biosynthesis